MDERFVSASEKRIGSREGQVSHSVKRQVVQAPTRFEKAIMSSHHGSHSRGSSGRSQFRRSRSIKSDDPLEIQGPLDVQGSVKSGGSISLDGDFMVKEKIDAYGAITMNGNVRCEGKIKAYGNIWVNGYLVAGDKIKGAGKLRVVGGLEGTELEIYGNLSITGYLNCQRLIVYGSLTLIGRDSSYSVSEYEEIAGARLVRDQEADWDW